MKILYFANLKQTIGKSEETIKIKGKIKIKEIINQLKQKNNLYKKAFENTKNLKCAINCEYADFDRFVTDGDEVAFFPPVTGG